MKWLLFMSLGLAGIASYGQRNTVYVEALGPGYFLSANIDKRFDQSNYGFGYRLGIGLSNPSDGPGIIVPAGLNYLAGTGKHHFLVGLTASLGKLPDWVTRHETGGFGATLSGEMGYRYAPTDRGLMFQLTWNPQPLSPDIGRLTWFGAALGYVF